MGEINESEFGTGKGWEEKIWLKFLEEIGTPGHNHKTIKFFDSILTANEKKLISKRLAALALVGSGKSYKEVGRTLWISPSTISALKKSVLKSAKYKSSRYHDISSKNEKRKKSKEIPPSTILNYWASLPLPSKTYRRHSRK